MFKSWCSMNYILMKTDWLLKTKKQYKYECVIQLYVQCIWYFGCHHSSSVAHIQSWFHNIYVCICFLHFFLALCCHQSVFFLLFASHFNFWFECIVYKSICYIFFFPLVKIVLFSFHNNHTLFMELMYSYC